MTFEDAVGFVFQHKLFIHIFAHPHIQPKAAVAHHVIHYRAQRRLGLRAVAAHRPGIGHRANFIRRDLVIGIAIRALQIGRIFIGKARFKHAHQLVIEIPDLGLE